MEIPVLFIIFNRLDTTKRVFEEIKKAKPPRLYIASDGPRENKVGEKEAVESVRKYVLDNIDWQCEVKTLFRDKNLGCRKNVSSAITWFFENEEMGMILEDDCLPIKTAFSYCEEMLKRFKNEKRIGSIACFNPVSYKTKCFENSYFFSKYSIIWGWGTWRDRWQHYDVDMKDWPEWKRYGELKKISNGKKLVELYWKKLFDFIFYYDNTIWDPQWTFIHFKNNWISVIPSKNQVLNIGFNCASSVNCSCPPPKFVRDSIPEEINFPLNHNNKISVSQELDESIEKDCYGINLVKIVGYYLKIFIKKIPFLDKTNIYRKVKNDYYKLFK